MSSHTSHMTDLEFIVFLPKLWVPTNFPHGQSRVKVYQDILDIQELLEASWMAWRITSLHSISFSAALFVVVVHSDVMIWCNKMWGNVITDIVLCLKIIHLLLYVVPLRIVRFCCCSVVPFLSRSIFKIFYLLFF